MLRRIVAVGLVIWILGACCPFGYTTKTTYQWGNPQWSARDVASVKSRCSSESNTYRRRQEQQIVAFVQQECRKAIPFDWAWVQPNGRPVPAEMAKRERNNYLSLCETAAAPSAAQREMMVYQMQSCYECRQKNAEEVLQSCYQNNGLRIVETRVPACQSMRLF